MLPSRGFAMYYVYLIRSLSHPDQRYVGFTRDLKERMSRHNRGASKHTAHFAPWELVTYIAFSEKQKAQDFERYLKTASGKAFSNKRLW
jgi:putative endonuclease